MKIRFYLAEKKYSCLFRWMLLSNQWDKLRVVRKLGGPFAFFFVGWTRCSSFDFAASILLTAGKVLTSPVVALFIWFEPQLYFGTDWDIVCL
jgi:hypothetical protein